MFRRIASTAVPRTALLAPSAVLPAAQHAGFFFAPTPFDDFLHAATRRPQRAPQQQGPPLQVVEAGDKVHVELDVPRFKAGDVEVKVDKDRRVVNVRGARANARGELQGRFERSFSVAPELDLDTVETSVADGVATISLARREARAASSRAPVRAAQPEPTTTAKPTAAEPTTAAPQPGAPSEGVATAAEAAPTSVDVPAGASPVEQPNAQAAQPADRAAPLPQAQAATTDEGYAAVRRMQWPPEMRSEHDERGIAYSCELPAGVKPENVDVRLERGCLTLGVRAALESVRKASHGRVVFETSRSVHYSTALPVPRNTRAGDVSVELKNGKLSIDVRRHADASDASNIRVQAA